jgi:hypothetical protein
MLRMPVDCDPAYPTAIMQAMAEGRSPQKPDDTKGWEPAGAEDIDAAVARFESRLADREFAAAVCWAVEHRADEKWGEGMLKRLSRLAIEHPDPISGELSVSSIERSDATDVPERSFDVVASARNCVRGAAAYAIKAIMFNQPEATAVLRPTLERLAADLHPAVRVAALGPTLPLLNIDPAEALDVFLRACSHPDDRVLRGHDVSSFFHYTLLEHLPQLRPLLDRMLASGIEQVAQTAASFVAQIWAFDGRLADLAEACQRDSKPQRQGLADGLALSVTEGRGPGDIAAALIRLFSDESEDVRNAAASVFREEQVFGRATGADLAEALVRSPALESNTDNLLWGLDHFIGSLRQFAATIEAVVARLISRPAAETETIGQRSWDGGTLAKLLLRLYEQAEHDPDLRRRCLDAWDSLLRDGHWFDVLKHIDGTPEWG